MIKKYKILVVSTIVALLGAFCSANTDVDKAGLVPQPGVIGGSKPFDYAAFQEKLDNALALWNKSNRSNGYRFAYTVTCFCIPQDWPWTVDVEADGTVRTASDSKQVPREPEDVTTVERIFTVLQAAIDNEADSISASFDATYGYPISVYIDYSFGVADEEYDVDISSFELFTDNRADAEDIASETGKEGEGAKMTDMMTQEQMYQDSRALWEYWGIRNYDFQYDWIRFRPFIAYPLTVQVREGQIWSAVDRNNEFVDVAEAVTIDIAFDTIGEAFNNSAFKVDVAYDPIFGYPTTMFLDYIEYMADDELYVTVHQFENKEANTTDLRPELDASMELWENSGISSYTFSFSLITNAVLDFPFSIRVVNGIVESAVDANGLAVDGGELYTMDYFFERITDAIEGSAFIIEATFDEQYGYPKEIAIDTSDIIADEEFYSEIMSFSIISTEELPVVQMLTQARSLWEGRDSPEYSYEFEQTCPACASENFPWNIYVGENTVLEATDSTGGPVQTPDAPKYTIEELFDMIQTAVDEQAPIIDVTYHESLGYPLRGVIDYDETTTEADFVFSITTLSLALESTSSATTVVLPSGIAVGMLMVVLTMH